MSEAKPDAEGFAEDAPSLPTPSAVNRTDNKFDGVGNPDDGTLASVNVTWGENDFPRQTGSDSLSEDEAVIT